MAKTSPRKLIPGVNDLASTHPDIASQAYEWNPSEVTAGMAHQKKWICTKGHVWTARIQHRVTGSGCAVCSNHQIIPEINSLRALHPEIASYALGWDPGKVGAGSSSMKLWTCPSGHEFKMKVQARVSGQQCAVCAGRQVQVGKNDLASQEPQIASEADGWDSTLVFFSTTKRLPWKCKLGHKWSVSVRSRVIYRSGCPSCSGLRVIQNVTDLKTNYPEISKEAYGWDPSLIKAGSAKRMSWQCPKGHIYDQSPNLRTRRDSPRGCPFCSGRQVLAGFNDLTTTHPEISTLADGWDPSTVSMGQTQKLSWKCSKGHTWQQSPNHMVKHKYLCPTCQKESFKFYGKSLQEAFPHLAIESEGWNPKEIGAGSGRVMKWKCHLGHTWKASVANRVIRGSGCPICAGQKVWPGFNDLLSIHPSIASEADGWDPSLVLAGGISKRNWICSEGHSYSAGILNRIRGTGCPSCAAYGFDPNKPAILYYMRNLEKNLLQIGITNNPEKRVRLHQQRGWEFIESWGPADGLLVKGWEQSILNYLRSHGADIGNRNTENKFDGYTESWRIDSFKQVTLKQLMHLAQDY